MTLPASTRAAPHMSAGGTLARLQAADEYLEWPRGAERWSEEEQRAFFSSQGMVAPATAEGAGLDRPVLLARNLGGLDRE